MAKKKLVVDGATLGFKASAPAVTGAVTFVSSPSTKVKAKNSSMKGAYKGNVQFKVAAGCTDGSCTSSADYLDTFSPGSTKGKIEGDPPLREDDEKVCAIPGTTWVGAPCTINATVVVSDPGQTKVSSE